MAIIQAQAKLYQGFRSYVVDKNISANLSAAFTIGNQNQPSPTLDGNGNIILQSGVKVFKIVRTIADLFVSPSVSLTNERYKTYGGGNNVINANGSVDNTNNSKIISTLTCSFPTFFRLDLEALGLPEGTDCVVKLEEGFVIEDRGLIRASGTYPYPLAVSNPNPASDSFATFRTPKTFAKKALSVVSSLSYNIQRIRPFAATLSGAMTFVVRLKYANAQGIEMAGSIFTMASAAVKRAVGTAAITAVSTITAPFVRAREFISTINSTSSLTQPSASGRIRTAQLSMPSATFIFPNADRFARTPIPTLASFFGISITPVKTVRMITTEPVFSSLSILPVKLVSGSAFMTAVTTCKKDNDIVWVWRGSSFAGNILQTDVGSANAYSAEIDWGDGSPTEDISGYTNIAHFHIYPSYGDWTIRLRPKPYANSTLTPYIGGIGGFTGGNFLGQAKPGKTRYNPTQTREAAWTGISGSLNDGHILKWISFGEGKNTQYESHLATISGLFRNQRYLIEVPNEIPSTIANVSYLFMFDNYNNGNWHTKNHTNLGKRIENWDTKRFLMTEFMFYDIIPSFQPGVTYYINYDMIDFRKWRYVGSQPGYAYPGTARRTSMFRDNHINQDLSLWCVPVNTAWFSSNAPLFVSPVWGTCPP